VIVGGGSRSSQDGDAGGSRWRDEGDDAVAEAAREGRRDWPAPWPRQPAGGVDDDVRDASAGRSACASGKPRPPGSKSIARGTGRTMVGTRSTWLRRCAGIPARARVATRAAPASSASYAVDRGALVATDRIEHAARRRATRASAETIPPALPAPPATMRA
jgi:hypothetical protein